MSTDAARPAVAATLGQFPWQRASATSEAPAIRPFMTADPDVATRDHGARDLVLPSLLAERADVAQREGYDRGFEEGEQAGREAAGLRSGAHLSRLAATITELSSLRTRMLRRSEQDVVRLAIAIAERIVGREIRVNRHVLSTMANAAARKLGDNCVATILMHPDDLLAATSGRGAAPDEGPIRLTADASVPPGGCLVQSAFGTIDVGLDAQIREIEHQLLGGDAQSDLSGDTGARG